jgi:hypothetical protein
MSASVTSDDHLHDLPEIMLMHLLHLQLVWSYTVLAVSVSIPSDHGKRLLVRLSGSTKEREFTDSSLQRRTALVASARLKGYDGWLRSTHK